MKLTIYTDGGARGNPGPAGIGVVIAQDGRTIKKYAQHIGKATNNQAEYQAVIFALQKVKQLLGRDQVKKTDAVCRLDSELVVKQLNGDYKIKEKEIQTLFLKLRNLTVDFRAVSFEHIPRERNQEADRLVNEALDQQAKTQTLF